MKNYTENVLEAPDRETVCWCASVSAGTIRAAVASGARTLDALRATTGACIKGGCTANNPRGRCCSVDIVRFLPQDELLSASCACCECGKE